MEMVSIPGEGEIGCDCLSVGDPSKFIREKSTMTICVSDINTVPGTYETAEIWITKDSMILTDIILLGVKPGKRKASQMRTPNAGLIVMLASQNRTANSGGYGVVLIYKEMRHRIREKKGVK